MSIDLDLLSALLRGPTDRGEEAAVLALLRQASPAGFDKALTLVDAAALFGSLDDRLFGPDNLTALRHLVLERFESLSIPALANVVYGLHVDHTDRDDEEMIARIFCGTKGVRLTELKNAINNRDDHYDIEALVFTDIHEDAIRAKILNHIAAEAAGIDPGEAKILCDIDDTVSAALHDRRYPRGTVYPGVLALLDALDRGPTDVRGSLDLTFVTARPGDVFGLVENHTRARLRAAGIASHSVLTGTFAALVNHDRMAARKVVNITHYHALFPEYRLVFIGDSGQGDVTVGASILEQFPDAVDAVLIHDVVGNPDQVRNDWAATGIESFETYIGAACLLQRRGMIADTAVTRVIEQSLTDLAQIAWESPEQERKTRALFARDLAAVGELGASLDG